VHPQETAPASAPYRYEYAEEARKLALMRLSDEELAWHFEVSPETFRDWMANEPELARAVRYGRKLGDAEVLEAFHHNAIGYSHEAVKVLKPAGQDQPVTVTYTKHYPPNTAAGKFWLCNRLPEQWRMKVEIEARPKIEDVGALERRDLNRLIAELAQARGFVPENPPAGWPRGVPAAAQ
jgi:hypothetical protein